MSFKISYVILAIATLATGACKQSKQTVPGIEVPEGFVVEQAVLPGLVKYPMFATLDNTGRLFVAESNGVTTSTEDVLENPAFFIRLLEDVNHDGVYDKSTMYADSIPYPMGGTFYRGSFYTAAPPDLLKLTDTNGDGVADRREIVLTGWVLNHNAATLSGPFPGPDGWMYLCDARRSFDITTKEGARLQGKGARIWRCRPDGTGLEVVSGGGFDNTIEMAFMPSGETIGTMTYFTDPRDGFRDALMHWVEGGVYPKNHASIADDKLKLTGDLMPVMTKLARVSHSGIMRYRGTATPEFQGNLFTAEFNTGRLMRHTVTPDGATYQTQTEPFMTSTIADFHPTDVLEDGDGSILFVNTGGWFIAGCPLSVVAKTEVHGGIFRIRREDAPSIDDPWGTDLDISAMSPEALTLLMVDKRPAVRDNAIEELVMRGATSEDALTDLMNTSTNVGARIAAVFALYRIGLPETLSRVVQALDDDALPVRVAAARACGLAKEKSAVEKLLQMVLGDEPPAQRQAATALGQIGDVSAVETLLTAAENPPDRFVGHAVIYSLITLQSKEPLVNALAHQSINRRKSALIALDQMDGSPIEKQAILPFLRSEDASLRSTAMWVLVHHPAWDDVVLTFLKEQQVEKLTGGDITEMTNLIVAFARDAQVQRWMADRLQSANIADAERWMVLDAMRQTRLKEFPAIWTNRLSALLTTGNAETVERVLALIEARRIAGLEEKLGQIFMNTTTSPSFKLKALNARIVSNPRLSPNEFTTLLSFLDSTQVSTTRQFAVRILAQADLNEEQLKTIAREYIPRADATLLPGLVAAFEGAPGSNACEALVNALAASPAHLEALSLPDLERIVQSFAPEAKAKAGGLVQKVRQLQATRLSALKTLEASLSTGDVGAGRALFYGKALCSTCHAVSGNGADFGPDLTNIGEIRSQHDILEAIVYPSASFAREYETSRVMTTDATYTGVVKEQFAESIVLESGPGAKIRIFSSDIQSIEPQPLSMMPPGLHLQLSQQELSDLIAYLRSLPDGMGHLRVTGN